MSAAQQDRRPNWVRTVAERIGPRPLPPEANPFDEAQRQWHELRTYAAEAADALRVADDAGRALALENDALRREVEHIRVYLGDQVATLSRENRMLSAYATNLRTRLTVIREEIQNAETEALQFAASDVRPKPVAVNVTEDAAVAEIHDAIVRANPDRRTRPPANQF